VIVEADAYVSTDEYGVESMNLYGYYEDEESQYGVYMDCYYYGDLETMEFDSSKCFFESYGVDYDGEEYSTYFMCYD
jgi:hypothetical protein